MSKINRVLGVEVFESQVQVIVGQIIEDLYFEVEKIAGVSNADTVKKDRNIKTLFVDFLQLMAGIMSPVIPSLIVAGCITLILLVMQMFFHVDTSSPTYVIMNNLGQSAFYFLPVFVAYTAARKFDTEPVLAMLLAGFLLYPGWVSMVSAGSASGFVSYFGIPVLLITYNGSIIQVILSIFVMSRIDRVLKRIIPNSIRYFLKPVLLIVIMSVITLSVTGPLGGLVTNYLAAFINFLRVHVPWLAVPAIYLFSYTVGLLCPGFHLALIPIATANFATYGYDDFINIWFFCGTTVPGFTALWVALKTKSVAGKNVAFPAAISALFGGISEPTVYGILYKIPKLFLINTITGLVTAVYAGIVGLKAYGFGAYYLTNLLLFYGAGRDMQNLIFALVGVGIIAVVSFCGVFFTKWEWPEEAEEAVMEKELQNVKLTAPAKGEYVPQGEIADDAMAKGYLGRDLAIKPSDDKVYAPVSGVINSVAPTKHAITILSDEGAEVMVHMTLDTMKLEDGDIEVKVKVGDKVTAGQEIAVMDRAKLAEKGIDDTVVALLLNSTSYANVTFDQGLQLLIAEV